MNTDDKTTRFNLNKGLGMHSDSTDWLSEMDFMDDEVEFFSEMLRNYFMALAIKDFEHEKLLIRNRQTLANEIELMKQRITEHHEHLVELIDMAHPESKERDLEAEHIELAKAFRKLRKECIAYKKDLYAQVSGVIKEQKQKSLTR